MSSSSDTEDEDRPTWFDGKVEREVWQPSDGNGEATPELIESTRGKKAGHPSWKLFMGDIPADITPTNPPKYCYLDDKAVWAISKHSKFSREEKHRYWHFDFTATGMISVARPNRGRPAYSSNGVLASIPRRKALYYFCGSGSLKAPIPLEPVPSKREDSAAIEGKTKEPSQTPAPSIEKSVQPVSDTRVPEKPTLKSPEQPAKELSTKPSTKSAVTPPVKSAEKPVRDSPVKPPAKPYSEPTLKPLVNPSIESAVKPTPSVKPLEKHVVKPSSKPIVPLENSKGQAPAPPYEDYPKELSVELSGEKLSTDPDAMALVRLRQMSTMTGYSESPSTPDPNPSALVPSTYDFSAYTARMSKVSQSKNRPNALASSLSGSSKRSSSPTSSVPSSKRQRSRLEPCILPPEVTEGDEENERLRSDIRRLQGINARLRNQLANEAAQTRRKDAMFIQAVKERDAWRSVTREYHEKYLDVMDDLAKLHKDDLKIVQTKTEVISLVANIARMAAKQIIPLQDSDQNIDQILKFGDRHFKERGLEQQWREFEAEVSEQ